MAFGGNKFLYFACSREAQNVTNEVHYHVAIRLNHLQRRKTEMEFFHKNYGIVASFASLPKRWHVCC